MGLPRRLSERERQARLRAKLVGWQWADVKRGRKRAQSARRRLREG